MQIDAGAVVPDEKEHSEEEEDDEEEEDEEEEEEEEEEDETLAKHKATTMPTLLHKKATPATMNNTNPTKSNMNNKSSSSHDRNQSSIEILNMPDIFGESINLTISSSALGALANDHINSGHAHQSSKQIFFTLSFVWKYSKLTLFIASYFYFYLFYYCYFFLSSMYRIVELSHLAVFSFSLKGDIVRKKSAPNRMNSAEKI
ncbi:WD40 repeat-containing protein [Reticulomyxa filosa]|uniref:WD40 repeat-containing protein n=1 Tax=Reticulomyxa filosa TaxID=46433 RepID=X6N882_RETFI|nr:WD40 repeat-containing protein [Reticulomyxa filosa]|eukprot:ETO22123.1 WD40 repeat-containing protein [Reticulomyxa filosa]